MRPRNDREREVERLAKSLPRLTDAQHRWVMDKVIGWRIYRKGGKGWCEKCGSPIPLAREGGTAVCPHCGAALPVDESGRRKSRGDCYIMIVTTHRGWQLIRYFLVRWEAAKGSEPSVHYQEVIQKWCQPGRPTVTRGAGLTMITYCCKIPYSREGVMSIKSNSYFYTEWMRVSVYPRMRLFKVYRLKRRERLFAGDLTAEDLLAIIYSVPYLESLYKAGKMSKLKEAMRHHEDFRRYWPSVRVALRHKFIPGSWGDYFDYLKMLSYLRKDMRSPRYVAPPDYNDIHYLIMRQYQNKRAEEERRRWEREALRRAEAEERRLRQEAEQKKSFEERMERFRKLLIAVGGIEIRPLMTIQEFADEGKAMHHCVFALGYYKKPDSLILSARDSDGNRIETVEVNLREGRVAQSRGKFNTFTDRHDEIVAMVTARIGDMQRMAAT